MKRLLLSSIRWYQQYLSPDSGVFRAVWMVRAGCRYQPTCSEYMYQAVERYGIINGLFLGLRRILRCHPWSKAGYDPLPNDL